MIALVVISFTFAFITVKISNKVYMLQYLFLFLTFIFLIVDVRVGMYVLTEASPIYNVLSAVYQGLIWITIALGIYTIVYLFYDQITDLMKLGKRSR